MCGTHCHLRQVCDGPDARVSQTCVPLSCRVMVLKKLQLIGQGHWEQDGGTQQRLSHVR